MKRIFNLMKTSQNRPGAGEGGEDWTDTAKGITSAEQPRSLEDYEALRSDYESIAGGELEEGFIDGQNRSEKMKVAQMEDLGEISSEEAAGLRNDIDAVWDTGAGGGGITPEQQSQYAEDAMSELNPTDRQMAEAEIKELQNYSFDSKSDLQEYLDGQYGSPGEGVSPEITDAIWEGTGGERTHGGWVGKDRPAPSAETGAGEGDRNAVPSSKKMSDGTIAIDHVAYPDYVSGLSNEELTFIHGDAIEALRAMPDNPKAGYYADEINYVEMEMAKRNKAQADTGAGEGVLGLSSGIRVTSTEKNMRTARQYPHMKNIFNLVKTSQNRPGADDGGNMRNVLQHEEGKVGWFGNYAELNIPQEAVDDISQSGANDEAVDAWHGDIDFSNITDEDLKNELEQNDLGEENMKDRESQEKALLWMAAHDISDDPDMYSPTEDSLQAETVAGSGDAGAAVDLHADYLSKEDKDKVSQAIEKSMAIHGTDADKLLDPESPLEGTAFQGVVTDVYSDTKETGVEINDIRAMVWHMYDIDTGAGKTTPEWQNEAGEPLYNPIAGWRADEDDRE